MRQLLLLRHAKSSWDDPRIADHDRPLNGRGRAAAALMGRTLRKLGLVPDMVLVSTALRTQETWLLLGPWSEQPLLETRSELYLASDQRLLDELHRVPETVRSVLLIAHNPGMHELALRLVGSRAMEAGTVATQRLAQSYPTAALAEFNVPGPWWGLDDGGAQLVRFLPPRDLAESDDL